MDELLAANERYAADFRLGDLDAAPRRRLAVVACMDARLDVLPMLGLEPGDAHVVRNAGGIVTDDVVRSLVVSQRMLGTRDVAVVQHTGCGMLGFREGELQDRLEAEVGVRPAYDFLPFADLDESVRASLARIEADPFLSCDRLEGFVYSVETGALRRVPPPGGAA